MIPTQAYRARQFSAMVGTMARALFFVIAVSVVAGCTRQEAAAPPTPTPTAPPPGPAARPRSGHGVRAVGGGLERWGPVVQQPDEVAVHVIGGATKVEAKGRAIIGRDWVADETVILDAAQRAELDALLADETAAWNYTTLPSPLLCIFNADLGVVWKAKDQSREAVFCFSCGQIVGSSGIEGYDLKRFGAFAAKVFPARTAFQNVAAGKRPHD